MLILVLISESKNTLKTTNPNMNLKHLILTTLLILSFSLPLLAQSPSPQPSQVEKDKIASLEQIVNSISIGEKKISELSNSLKKEESKRIKEDLEEKIKEESDQINNLRNNFNIIVSEVDVKLIDDNSSSAKIDWTKEIEELLSPLVNEVKRLTSRPRELDRLQRRDASLKDFLNKENKAIRNIQAILKDSKDNELNKALKNLLEEWENKKTETATQISIAEQKLAQLSSEKTDFGKSIRELPNIFFRSRGKNLVLAFLATLLFWWALKKAYDKFTHLNVVTKRDSAGFRRALNLAYLTFSGSGSLSIFILVLFLLGDWVLLIISLMIVLGIVWTSKQALPQFWSQGALLLNIGPVKEKERIVYNNLLWEVHSLNLYTILKNPLMSPSTLRVPLSDLLSLRSRKEGPKEPWFPTKEGDWVLLNNETHARVTNQTPDQVILVKLGGARLTYDIPSFLSANPLNLSGGFRITKKFGLDYALQKEITSTVLDKIKDYIQEQLLSKLEETQFKLNVELLDAGSSSLDIAVIIDFSGELGAQYQSLQRLISKHCVDACNVNGWEIPFNQLTVHMKN